MKILGIDPGSRITGFGLIETNKLKLKYLSSGCIRTKSSDDLSAKIITIFESVYSLAKEHKPDAIVVERVFMRPDRPNPDAAIKLGHARGAIISAIGILKIPIFEYSPNQIKKTVVGHGHAKKDQVGFMVMQLLKLSKNPQEDAADALAGAICHAYHNY
jgi:crossover junction endodeoxyribonuclease RuvC